MYVFTCTYVHTFLWECMVIPITITYTNTINVLLLAHSVVGLYINSHRIVAGVQTIRFWGHKCKSLPREETAANVYTNKHLLHGLKLFLYGFWNFN